MIETNILFNAHFIYFMLYKIMIGIIFNLINILLYTLLHIINILL